MNLKTINPFTNKEIHTYSLHSNKQIDSIIEDVYKSYNDWKNTSFKDRKRLLVEIALHLKQNSFEYAKIITKEMGKPISESLSEINKCSLVCDYYAENGEAFLKSKYIETENLKSYVQYDPLGVVFGIMPWNFPFWQVFRIVAPSLMVGNVCILKHASNVTGCSVTIESLINKLSPIKNIFRSLIINSSAVGQIIEDNRISAVTLTGSETTGMSVAKKAGNSLKKCVLELGGSDPFIVLKDADIKKSAKYAINARFLNSGQSCIAAKRFIVHRDIYEDFIRELKEHFTKLKIGNPLDDDTNIGPLAKKEFLQEIDHLVQSSIHKGAKLIYGGKINKCFYEPTLLIDVKEDMPVFKEEFTQLKGTIKDIKDEVIYKWIKKNN